MLSKCAKSLALPLHRLFNLSLSTGVFPGRWKTSSITPIFKSGSRMDITNYRGISILATLGKLFESLVTNVLTSHLKSLITTSQHGFIKNRSTVTNLTEFTNIASNVIESGSQLDVVYTDFSKAFDKIDHELLLLKLCKIGIHSWTLKWLRSYLCGRKQYVNVNGVHSFVFNVLSGVPQGSHLGPLLFILFINDITSCFKYSNCLMYADDLKLFRTINEHHDAVLLQSDVDKLIKWCCMNGLHLNVNKCYCVSYTRKHNTIQFPYSIIDATLSHLNEIKDLGVIFDSKLIFGKHIEMKIAKSYSMLGFVKRICYEFVNKDALKSIYCAHVRSHLEYASVVWSPLYNSYKIRIESIQKKFIIFGLRREIVTNNYVLPPYSDRCKRFNLETLEKRRDNAGIFFIYDILMGFVDSPNLLQLIEFNVPSRRLRAHSLFRPIYHRTNYGINEPMSRMCVLFNSVENIFDFNLSRFMFRVNVRSNFG